MEKMFKPIVNSDLIGSFTEITLPGFPPSRGQEQKPEPCAVHYLEMGEGDPLLFVHTVGQSIYTWRKMMPILSRYYRVIALDLPGFGQSGRPYSLNYSMEEMTDCILQFMDKIGLQTTHALGFSLGAGYLLSAVVAAPDRFQKVVAICPGGVTPQMPRKVRNMEKPFLGPLARESYSKKYYRQALSTCYYDATLLTPEILDQYYATADDFASRQSTMYAIRNYDLDAVIAPLRTFKKEFLILWGNEDRWQPVENMDVWRDALPFGVYHTLRNAGHLMHEEKAEQVSEVVDKYILYKGAAL